jgi:hypothetical protein
VSLFKVMWLMKDDEVERQALMDDTKATTLVVHLSKDPNCKWVKSHRLNR